jgi:hypothetical protein
VGVVRANRSRRVICNGVGRITLRRKSTRRPPGGSLQTLVRGTGHAVPTSVSLVGPPPILQTEAGVSRVADRHQGPPGHSTASWPWRDVVEALAATVSAHQDSLFWELNGEENAKHTVLGQVIESLKESRGLRLSPPLFRRCTHDTELQPRHR